MKLLVFVFALTLLASSHAAWESLCGSDSECPTMMYVLDGLEWVCVVSVCVCVLLFCIFYG